MIADMKYIIIGIITIIMGIVFFVWNKNNPLFNEENDDGSIESGASQMADKQRDKKGYIIGIMTIVLGLILIYEGITGESPF